VIAKSASLTTIKARQLEWLTGFSLFCRVSDLLNLAVCFNARLYEQLDYVASATIDNTMNSAVANATKTIYLLFRALKHTAKFTASLTR